MREKKLSITIILTIKMDKLGGKGSYSMRGVQWSWFLAFNLAIKIDRGLVSFVILSCF